MPPLWHFVAVKSTKSDEVRARVEPLIKLAIEHQATNEHIEAPDIVRKALWEYLIRANCPLVLPPSANREVSHNQQQLVAH